MIGTIFGKESAAAVYLAREKVPSGKRYTSVAKARSASALPEIRPLYTPEQIRDALESARDGKHLRSELEKLCQNQR